jgi:ribonuclease HII
LIAGVDEAGRGCVIGPLVIAGCAIKEEKIPQLIRSGVKDSKKLSTKKRESIFLLIEKIVDKYEIIKLLPNQIDKVVNSNIKHHKLNRLEANTMASVIEKLKPNIAYIDAVDVLEKRFKQQIIDCLSIQVEIIAKHKADKLFPVVSAASIMAKVKRDEEISKLKKKYGDFGSGYLSDKKTIIFLKNWINQNNDYPSCVRKSWKPAKKIKSEKGTIQTKLILS